MPIFGRHSFHKFYPLKDVTLSMQKKLKTNEKNEQKTQVFRSYHISNSGSGLKEFGVFILETLKLDTPKC